ncbi:MAG: sulfotransferase [Saprospiraceae bacterium]
MIKYHLNSDVERICDKSFVITGSARSGTTILGKVVHSMREVEYNFEPASMLSLFSMIDNMDIDSWKFLYRNILYEELLINNLAGRGLNCNLQDDSSIYKVKTQKFIDDRLNKGKRKAEMKQLIDTSIPGFKLPSLVPFLEQFRMYFPNIKVVYIRRSILDNLNSLKNKAWFSDEGLKNDNRIWPLVKYKKYYIPFWVAENDYDLWTSLDEINRCAYYFIRMNRKVEIPNLLELEYDRVLKSPKKEIEKVAAFIGATFGDKTNELINSIKPTKNNRDTHLLNQLIPRFQAVLKSV